MHIPALLELKSYKPSQIVWSDSRENYLKKIRTLDLSELICLICCEKESELFNFTPTSVIVATELITLPPACTGIAHSSDEGSTHNIFLNLVECS